MTAENPSNNPETKVIVDDNARKFITEPIDDTTLTYYGYRVASLLN